MNNEPLSSASNPLIKDVRALEDKKARDERGQFFLAGLRDITGALQAGWVADLLLATPDLHLSPAERQILDRSVARRQLITPQLASRISGRDNPQALLAVLRQRWALPSDLTQGLWVVLEDIRDPGNLGTIMRTAVAAGAAGVALVGECCDPFAPETIRASVGTFVHCPVLRLSRADFLAWSATYQGQIVATHLIASQDYRQASYSSPALLLMGNESAGLSDALADRATMRVRIPMTELAESLNVATATALMLYEMQRRVL